MFRQISLRVRILYLESLSPHRVLKEIIVFNLKFKNKINCLRLKYSLYGHLVKKKKKKYAFRLNIIPMLFNKDKRCPNLKNKTSLKKIYLGQTSLQSR